MKGVEIGWRGGRRVACEKVMKQGWIDVVDGKRGEVGVKGDIRKQALVVLWAEFGCLGNVD